jgi:hypothetical protein
MIALKFLLPGSFRRDDARTNMAAMTRGGIASYGVEFRNVMYAHWSSVNTVS